MYERSRSWEKALPHTAPLLPTPWQWRGLKRRRSSTSRAVFPGKELRECGSLCVYVCKCVHVCVGRCLQTESMLKCGVFATRRSWLVKAGSATERGSWHFILAAFHFIQLFTELCVPWAQRRELKEDSSWIMAHQELSPYQLLRGTQQLEESGGHSPQESGDRNDHASERSCGTASGAGGGLPQERPVSQESAVRGGWHRRESWGFRPWQSHHLSSQSFRVSKTTARACLRALNPCSMKSNAFPLSSPPWPNTRRLTLVFSIWPHIGIAWGAFKSPDGWATPSRGCNSVSLGAVGLLW